MLLPMLDMWTDIWNKSSRNRHKSGPTANGSTGAPGVGAKDSVVMDSKSDTVDVLAEFLAKATVVLATTATQSHASTQSATPAPTGPGGQSGLPVPHRAVPVTVANTEAATVKTSPKDTTATATTLLKNPV